MKNKCSSHNSLKTWTRIMIAWKNKTTQTNLRSYATVVQESTPNQRATIPTNKIVQKQINRRVFSFKKRPKMNPLSHNQRSSTITANPKKSSHSTSINNPFVQPTQPKDKRKKHEYLQSTIVNQNSITPFHNHPPLSSPSIQKWNLQQQILPSIYLPKHPPHINPTFFIE